MKICYIDEAGDGRRPDQREADVPPVFVICGLVLDSSNLPGLTGGHLAAKARFRPAAGSQAPDGILTEIKGSDLRGNIRKGTREVQSLRFLDAVMDLLERHDVGLLGRVWIKNPLEDSDEKAIYTFSVQNIARHLQRHLAISGDSGLIVCDSRSFTQNVDVAHSVFTQKFRRTGDALPNIVEAPLFCHSDNHAGIQLADIVASALVFPMACRTYCRDYDDRLYANPAFGLLKERYGSRLMALQRKLRYRHTDGTWAGGLMVRDLVHRRHGGLLFR